jgi:hypothetical protein
LFSQDLDTGDREGLRVRIEPIAALSASLKVNASDALGLRHVGTKGMLGS